MPRQKQPIALQKLAFDSLVEYVVDYCDSVSLGNKHVAPQPPVMKFRTSLSGLQWVFGWTTQLISNNMASLSGLFAQDTPLCSFPNKDPLTELPQAVAAFKQHLRDHMPRILFTEFCRKFLNKFYVIGYERSEKRPASHQKAALEMIMDVEFVGLIFEGDIVQYVDPGDAHRIKGMRTLYWGEMRHRQPYHHPPLPRRSLENYCLQDLTTFVYPSLCTDMDLEIIGPRCLKLEVLKIQDSKHVTDRGLRAIRPCTELRIINLHYCSVSDDGVNELLNFHNKLEEFNVGDYFEHGKKDFDVLSRPISLVCLSVKRFSLKPDRVKNTHLHSVVALFPNLTYLEICRPFTGDLRILKDLKNLKEIVFRGRYCGGYSMENLKEFLTSVGENISQLTIEFDVGMTQNDLNFISEVCSNVEVLYVCYSPRLHREKLIMPSFQRLKHLVCIASAPYSPWHVELEFGKMLSLESFRIQDFDAIFQLTESMMLDNVKFPNLKEVQTFFNDHYMHVNRIRNTAINNNLDFKLRFAQ